MAEQQADIVIKALNKVTLKGKRIIVEIAGENNGKSDKSGKKRDSKASKEKKETPAKEKKASKKEKPSREERGYTSARGPKHKDDWKQFFIHDNDSSNPGFDDAGMGKKKKKK